MNQQLPALLSESSEDLPTLLRPQIRGELSPVWSTHGVVVDDGRLDVSPELRICLDAIREFISKAAKYTLFEFNDDFTRTQLRNWIEPYLKGCKTEGKIHDYRVICDETNNTDAVIDRNEFVGDIYIQPKKNVSFIQLNFIAVRTSVSFDDVVSGDF